MHSPQNPCLRSQPCQREDANPNPSACCSCFSSPTFKLPLQSHLLYFLRCPRYSSQMGQFTIPTFSSSSLYLCAGSFLAGKVLLLLIFQSPSQSQFLHWFSLIILTRHDLLALTSSEPFVLSYFSNTNLVPGKQNRGLLNKWVLNEWAAVN